MVVPRTPFYAIRQDAIGTQIYLSRNLLGDTPFPRVPPPASDRHSCVSLSSGRQCELRDALERVAGPVPRERMHTCLMARLSILFCCRIFYLAVRNGVWHYFCLKAHNRSSCMSLGRGHIHLDIMDHASLRRLESLFFPRKLQSYQRIAYLVQCMPL
ncbi:hypothetical protein OBBRIDRAFT_431156 [Obba rivulosa]|uniref:Uncharacterized protein n=1 Tax=Obba rivulosa TaxID=1052685 RepID=A0A8E2AIS7_9APHY|nr:hypothetical protein OBBRIDRAFT_431156 [Obba rivulosa]